MTSIKTVKNKIESVVNTKKITKTMEMVSISKMKKIKKTLEMSNPYSNVIKNVIFHILESKLKYKHIFLNKRKIIKNIGIIVVSSNKGLCGSLNSNVFKCVNRLISKYCDLTIKPNLYVIGKKGLLFFKNSNSFNVSSVFSLTDNINELDLIKPTEYLLNQYKTHIIDKLFIVSNKFYNNMSQKPYILQLLPFDLNLIKEKKNQSDIFQDYIYEPDSQLVLNLLFKKYILFQIFQSILENTLCEQISRMIAMRTASDNSDNIFKELQVMYNKMRQFSITQEIIEIISGASLVSENK